MGFFCFCFFNIFGVTYKNQVFEFWIIKVKKSQKTCWALGWAKMVPVLKLLQSLCRLHYYWLNCCSQFLSDWANYNDWSKWFVISSLAPICIYGLVWVLWVGGLKNTGKDSTWMWEIFFCHQGHTDSICISRPTDSWFLVSDWLIIMIGPSGLLSVVSHLFEVRGLVLWGVGSTKRGKN